MRQTMRKGWRHLSEPEMAKAPERGVGAMTGECRQPDPAGPPAQGHAQSNASLSIWIVLRKNHGAFLR